jgi:hypothetical protein
MAVQHQLDFCLITYMNHVAIRPDLPTNMWIFFMYCVWNGNYGRLAHQNNEWKQILRILEAGNSHVFEVQGTGLQLR